MRSGSYYALFAAHIAVGFFALANAAAAQQIIVTSDTTITDNASGDPGGTASDDDNGDVGGAAVAWFNPNVDVLIDPGLNFFGGAGGQGGFDAANDGGNAGGDGGQGIAILGEAGTLTANGIFVFGGDGGDGSNGGAGGIADAKGGIGGTGAAAILAGDNNIEITLTNSIIIGGDGGNGGDAGDSAADDTDGGNGGFGQNGAAGVALKADGAIVTLNNTSVTGGNGGNGGTALSNGANGWSGFGGAGIAYSGTNATISIGFGSVVAGGDAGVPGTGGSSGGLTGADGAGIELLGSGATLTNHGTLLGSDTQTAAALSISGDTVLVDNFGTIGAATNHAGRGIWVFGGATVTTLHNEVGGIIHSSGPNQAVAISPGASVGTFINEGSIIGDQAAIFLGGTVGSFSNSGMIQATSGMGLFITSADIPDTIFNTGGTIASSGPAAIGISTDLGPSGLTVDGGLISGLTAILVGPAQTGAIGVKNADVDGDIVFTTAGGTLNVTASTLSGDMTFAGGSNNLNFLSGGTTTITSITTFSSTNTLFFSLLGGADVVSNAVQNDGNSAITQLTTVANSHLTLNEGFLADNKVLNDGVIEIAAGKTLTTKLLNGGGVYTFGVADASTVGAIKGQGTGSALDFTGASLEIKLTNPADMFAAGTKLLLAEDLNGNAILGTANGTSLMDNSALLHFVLFRGDAPQIGTDDGQLFARVQVGLLADIAGYGDDPNAIALGAALDEIGLDGNTDIDDQMLALAMLATNAEVNAMLDSLLPETDGVAYDIATDAGDQILDVASRRLDGLRGTAVAMREYKLAGAPVGSSAARANGIWAQAFGRAVDQSKHDYNDGYDAGTYGFAVGADTSLKGGKAQLGVAFAYSQTDADGNGINHTDTDVDSYQLTLYGDHAFADAVYAKGLIAYGWHQNDIVRHDVGGVPGSNASGNYDATQFNARAEIGRAFAAGTNLTLIPRFDLTYAAYDPDSYSETGVGGLGLNVDGESLQSFRLGAGVLARWDIPLESGLLQPELRINYRRDLSRDRFETTSEFIGAPGVATFRTQGVEPPADILNLGIGALLATAGGIDLRASYDLELKEDYTAHGGYIRASLPF